LYFGPTIVYDLSRLAIYILGGVLCDIVS